MFAPKGGAIDDDGTWDQLVRDMRNLSEQPDAAKRMQLMRAPMEYTRTQATLEEMAIVDLMSKNRDDLLALWGVPLSQVGGTTPAGMNSGDIRKYDKAALWENAIVTRLVPLKQRIQRRLLDRFEAYIGWAPKLVLEIPETDDDSPRYDKLQKAQFIGLTQDERRALINFDPLPEDMIGPTGKPMGQEVWLPTSQAPVSDHSVPPSQPITQQPMVPAWAAGAMPQVSGPVPGGQSTGPANNDGTGQTQGGPALSTMASLSGQAGKAKADVTDAVMAALRKQWTPAQLAIVRQGSWSFEPKFPMDKINADRRPNGRNPAIVAGAEAVLAIGAPISPATIIHTKRIGKPGYEPIDGWHRILAAQHQGMDTIPAYVGEGDDAWTKQMIALDDDMPTPQLPGKASTHRQAMLGLRETLQAQVTPTLQAGVQLVLDQQKRSVISRVRTNWDHVKSHPAEHQTWFGRPGEWDAALLNALRPGLMGVAQTVAGKVKTLYGAQKADPVGVVDRVLKRKAARVTGINETTQAAIAAALAQVIEDDGTLDEAIAALEGLTTFDDYRAEMVARTELMDAYNASALNSYADSGFGWVEATDGDQDEECANRLANNPYTVDDAMSEEDHPNGTLDWVPLFEDEVPKATLDTPDGSGDGMLTISMRLPQQQAPIVNMPVQPAPIVNVAQPKFKRPKVNVSVASPAVNVEAPNIKVKRGRAPKVRVNLPAQTPRRIVVERDITGKMSGAHQEEMDE